MDAALHFSAETNITLGSAIVPDLQHGFRGKADKIEVSALLRRVKYSSDSKILEAEHQSGRSYVEKHHSEKSEQSQTRILETRSWPLIMVFIVLVGLIGIGWWLKKFVIQRLR